MAKAYPVEQLKFIPRPDDAFLSFAERRLPEAANQTWSADSPLKLVGGALAEWINQADSTIYAFALKNGQNLAAASHGSEALQAQVILCHEDLAIEANLLGAAAATYVLLATDEGAVYDLAKSATLYQGYPVGVSIAPGQLMTAQPGWYVRNTKTGTGAVKVTSFVTTSLSPTSADFGAVPGDTNARIRCHVLAGVSDNY